jgi:hypothetical protein
MDTAYRHDEAEEALLQRNLMRFLLCAVSMAAAPTWGQDFNKPRPSPSRVSDSVQSGEITEAPIPDAPSASQKGPASVSGGVRDSSGSAVSGAQVTLTSIGKAQARFLTAGADGRFIFDDVLPGFYVIVVAAKGFQPVTSARFTVVADQAYEVPSVKLVIPMVTTEVVVQPTDVLAAQQTKAEEQQRVSGIIPNFYTSYIWNAAPLNAKQKFSLAAHNAFDPVVFIGVSLGAGIEQAKNAFPGYGQGTEGYAKRWAALFANGRTSDFLSRAVFPSLFHQDPRYFYQGSGSNWSRTKHAVSYAFVARSDSGRLMPNYSYFLGDVCSGALSNLYYPPSSRGAGLVFTDAAIGLAGRVGLNVANEFLFKRLTKNVHK